MNNEDRSTSIAEEAGLHSNFVVHTPASFSGCGLRVWRASQGRYGAYSRIPAESDPSKEASSSPEIPSREIPSERH